jgi:hypothetical protein
MIGMWKKLLLVAAWLVAAQSQAQVQNAQYSLLTSAVQTAAQVNSPDQYNLYYRGVHVVVTVTVATAGTYTPKLQGKDAVTGQYYDLLVGPAIMATGVTVLKIYPGIASSVNGSASDFLPAVWRLQLNGAAGQNMTLSATMVLEN